MNQLEKKTGARLEWSDVKILRAISVFLDTQSWRFSPSNGTTEEEYEIREAVEYIMSHCREPLEAKGVNLANIQDELEEIVPYAWKFLSIG